MNMSIAIAFSHNQSMVGDVKSVQQQKDLANSWQEAKEQRLPQEKTRQTLNTLDENYRITLKIERELQHYNLETELKYYKYNHSEQGQLLDTLV